ncbi:MAG: hypothetical protein ACI9LM_005009 [Alteromonadaceae bacterium]|jgi:hypothetical protein
MIIFNIPVGSRKILRTVKDWLKDAFILSFASKSNKSAFNFIYFSYAPDFEYLLLSLKSLVQNTRPIRSIYLFVDQKAPFSEEQCQTLINIYPDLIFKTINNFEWASAESTKAEIDAFLDVVKNSLPNDYIVKVDSDILFLNSTKMSRIAASGLDAIGDGHWERYKFFQGGLYIIKVNVAERVFSNFEMDDLKNMIKEKLNNITAEDRCVTQILRDNNIKLYYTSLMLFPSEYQKLSKFNWFVKWNFSALHFVRDKDNMASYYKRLFG